MRNVSRFWALALICPSAALGITLGQVDTFQDGTTQGWGGYATAVNIPTGGPAGVGDKFLALASTGGSGAAGELKAGGAGSQWSGDYIDAGVTAISMDFLNLGTVDLEMRILIYGNHGDWTSTVPFIVPPDSQWHQAVFGLTAADLSWGGSGGSFANLDDALRFMGGPLIRHQSGPPLGASGGTPIATQLGIDNIMAIPEPSMIWLGVVGTGTLYARRRRSI